MTCTIRCRGDRKRRIRRRAAESPPIRRPNDARSSAAGASGPIRGGLGSQLPTATRSERPREAGCDRKPRRSGDCIHDRGVRRVENRRRSTPHRSARRRGASKADRRGRHGCHQLSRRPNDGGGKGRGERQVPVDPLPQPPSTTSELDHSVSAGSAPTAACTSCSRGRSDATSVRRSPGRVNARARPTSRVSSRRRRGA